MRKRIAGITALTAAAAVALGLPTAGTSAPPDVKGPKCANIFLVEPGYSGTVGGSGTVFGTLTTPTAPSCAGAVYTVYVYDSSGTTQLGTPATFIGDGVQDAFSYTITFADAPQSVCVYATSMIGGHVADTAPNNSCALTEIGSGGGAGGFG